VDVDRTMHKTWDDRLGRLGLLGSRDLRLDRAHFPPTAAAAALRGEARTHGAAWGARAGGRRVGKRASGWWNDITRMLRGLCLKGYASHLSRR
jgi:hypothetical protein